MLLASVIIVSLLTVGLGILVYVRNPNQKANIYFVSLSVSIAGWIIFNYLADHSSDVALGASWTRLLMACGLFIVFFVLAFVSTFVYEFKFANKALLIIAPFLLVSVGISLFTDQLIKSVYFKNNIA